MAIEEISRIPVGDMILRYEQETDYATAGFSVIPADMDGQDNAEKFYRINSLVQMKLVGDMYPNCYGHGSSMRNSESANRLDYKSQVVEETEDATIVKTFLEDARGYRVTHIVTYYQGDESFEMKNIVENVSGQDITMEMLSSFELGNISPFLTGDGPEKLLVHRLRSKWSHEGRLSTETVEDLQLEPSWSTWSVSSERFGQTGSMPVKKFFPFVAIEDTENEVLWGVQLAHEASWQMEVYRQDDALHISGGIADREFGHWMKVLHPGESFETPTAIVSVCHGGGIDRICHRLTQAAEKYLDDIPESEQHLPIIFNEYCTTWGCPSHENISGIINAIKDRDFEYFVIDCGWFKEDGVPWDISMGDYNISPTLFPEGLKKTVDMIKAAGMKPGIWFEIDNIGSAAKAYHNTEHQLKRDGYPITTYSRRFWDMTDPWVTEYLTEKVIKTLNTYGFEYMKMDYNDTIGIGCDGSESLGEGLRKNMEASVDFVRKVLAEVPGIILENCASGGHKLEPLMMSLCSMASFSDAHECEEIPVIAANLHRAILPRQSQIWAVIRKTDSVKRIAYSIANTFLGRMCLSGDVTELTEAQWKAIDDGMAFYKKIVPIIRKGYTYHVSPKIGSERHLKGWQGIVRTGENGQAYVLIHTLHGGYPEVIEIPLPDDCPDQIIAQYSDETADVIVENRVLKLKTAEDMRAVAVLLAPQERKDKRNMNKTGFYIRPYTVNWNNEESDSLHLEYSYDKEDWYAFNGDNGILFAQSGSKRMAKPQIVKDGDSFRIYAMDAVDNDKVFCYESKDLITFGEEKVAERAETPEYTAESAIVEITQAQLENLQKRFGKPEEVVIDQIEEICVEVKQGETPELPETVQIVYSNGEKDTKKVTWGEVDTESAGEKTVTGTIYEHQYTNPIIYHRADPFIYKHTDGYYYFTGSHTDMEHNLVGKYQYRNITLRRAKTLEGLADNSGLYEERVVYQREPLPGDNSPHIWAPEIHFVRGKWYIYFTTVIDENEMWSIRPHVLECADADPFKGEWVNLGRVQTTTNDSIAFTDFSLDHTVFEHNGELYMFWPEKHPADSVIYVAKMVNPWTIDSGRICAVVAPEYNWERHGFPVCEGPAVLQRNGKIFLVYSAAGTDALYCLGMCTADENADLLDPASWTKSEHPVFQSSRKNGQFGPGHNSFTKDEEGHDVMVYHARQEERYLVDEGYQPLYDAGRNATLMRIYWNEDGTPNFSVPIPSGKGHDIPTEFTAKVIVK